MTMKAATHVKIHHTSILLFLFSLLMGCSGIKTYPNTANKNFHIKTETDSGSMLSKVRTAVNIYRVDADCKTEYEGTVQLKSRSVDIGIPAERLSYLVFVFSSSGFLSSSSSTITYDGLLKLNADYLYDVKVSYVDDIYNVVIRETDPRNKKSREIELKDLNECDSF
jgi:hypothetical protein